MKKYSKFLLAFLMGVKAVNECPSEVVSESGRIHEGPREIVSEAGSVMSNSTISSFNSIADILNKKQCSKEELSILEKYLEKANLYSEISVADALIGGKFVHFSSSDFKTVRDMVSKALKDCYAKVENKKQSATGVAESNTAAAEEALNNLKNNPVITNILKKYDSKDSYSRLSIINKNGKLVLHIQFVEKENNSERTRLSFDVGFDDCSCQAVTSDKNGNAEQIILTFNVISIDKYNSKKHVPINIRCRFNVEKYNNLVGASLKLNSTVTNSHLSGETKNRIQLALKSKDSASKFFDAMEKFNVEFIIGTYFSRQATDKLDDLDKVYMKVKNQNRKDVQLAVLEHVINIEQISKLSGSWQEGGAVFENKFSTTKLRALEPSFGSFSDAFKYVDLKAENHKLDIKTQIKESEKNIKNLKSRKTKTSQDESRIKDLENALNILRKNGLSAEEKAKIKHNKVEMQRINSNPYNLAVKEAIGVYYSDSKTMVELMKKIDASKHTIANADARLQGKDLVHTKKTVSTPQQPAHKKEKTTCHC